MGFRASKETVADWQARGLIAPTAPSLPVEISEKEFMAAVIAEAKRNGWLVNHHTISKRSEPGWPDLCCLHPGRGLALFAELKTNAGALTEEQQAWGQAMLRCGLDWRIWRPCQWQEVVEILRGSPALQTLPRG